MQEKNQVEVKFQEKYPFLNGQYIRTDPLLPRGQAEARGGALFADILQTNSLGMYVLRKEGVLGYYLSPENRFYPKQFKDEGYWTTANTNIYVIAYNTKKVTRENLPKSYEDLLKPVWKGKMMLQLQEQWFANMLQIMGREKGLNYMRELSKQNIMIRQEASPTRAQLLAAGEVDLDINNAFGAVEELKKKGASIDWTTVGPVPAPLGAFGISASAPHPNAAKLFLDFVLSKEGQKIFIDLGRLVVRSDLLEEQKVLKNLNPVPLDPSLGEQLADYAKQMREIFKVK